MEKYTVTELILFALVGIILLYFPYQMIVEHSKDIAAIAWYKK